MGDYRVYFRNDEAMRKGFHLLEFDNGSKTEGCWWKAEAIPGKSEVVKRKAQDGNFPDVFDIIGEACLVIDISSGSLVNINKTTVDLFGYARTEVLGLGLEIIDRDGTETSRQEWKRRMQAVANGKRQTFAWRCRKKNGDTLWCEVRMNRCRIDHQDRLLVVLRDISEEKRVEESLREAESRFHSIMKAIEDPAYICSEKLKIEYMNPTMIRKFSKDAIGRSCYETIYRRDSRCPWCTFDKALKGEHIEYELLNQEDNRYYHISSSPVLHTDQSISQLTVLKDKSESRELTRQLQQSQKMEAIGTLAGGIAHDFNNILFPIIGYIELLREDIAEGSHLQGYLDEIMIAASRAKKLVHQILTFSRHSEKEPQPQNFQAIVKESLNLVRSTLPSTIQIEQNLNNRSGLVMADSTQIHQVVMNMVTNAFHAMEEKGGVLTVSLDHVDVRRPGGIPAQGLLPGPYARLIIADTGIGIDKNLLGKVFDPYFTTKEKGKGTGMGLSLVHGIVKDSGGTVLVESKKGKGTTFTVYLPTIDRKQPSKAIVAKTLKSEIAAKIRSVLDGS